MTRVAVLHQAIEPPIINGLRKPMKPGGYQDSCADIAFNLNSQPGIQVITPLESPDPSVHAGWSFPDTEEGILSALDKGATHLFANTVVFFSHPLQSSERIGQYQDTVRVIGHPPCMVELYDDKHYLNEYLRQTGKFTFPRGWLLEDDSADIITRLKNLDLRYPVVGKPVRGRGSHGVKVCHDQEELRQHVQALFKESPSIILEDYLSGEEGTVTVMPPSDEHSEHWALPIVTRFNHANGVAPYNGIVAVTANSRVVTPEEYEKDPNYAAAAKECAEVAKLLKLTAIMRIDIRRFSEGSKFALFDVNMKPVSYFADDPKHWLTKEVSKNMTGPGRPNRDDQASLSAMAAARLGWDYPRLLREMLKGASILRVLRETRTDSAKV